MFFNKVEEVYGCGQMKFMRLEKGTILSVKYGGKGRWISVVEGVMGDYGCRVT